MDSVSGWRAKSSLMFFIMVLILVSLTCRITSTQEAAPETLPAATIVAEPSVQAQRAVPLPPSVIETHPMNGGEVNSVEGVRFYFNQPMKTDTVQAALTIEPYLQGIFEWLDNNRTLHFQPNAPLMPATLFKVTLKTSAQAENNLQLVYEQTFDFRTPESLQIVERIPEPGSKNQNPSSAISVAFNQPVVPLDGDPSVFPPAFSLFPEVHGQGKWLNSNTYVFYPEPALSGGTDYTVTVNSALVSASGMSFAGDTVADLSWIFTTAQPEVIACEPAGGWQRIAIDIPFVIDFNQPMDTASVEQNLTLLGPRGVKVDGSYRWENHSSRVIFQPERLLQRNTTYTLTLPKETISLGGSPLSKDFRREFLTVAPLTLVKTIPASGKPLESGYNRFVLEFNVPLGEQNLEDFVEVQPKLIHQTVSLSLDRKTMYLSGFYEPNLAYLITLSADLQDLWGRPLGETKSAILRVLPAEPSLTVPMLQFGSPVLFILPDDPYVAAQATNVQAIKVSSAVISFDTFTALVKRHIERGSLSINMVPAQETWMHALELEPNRNTTVEIPLSSGRTTLPTGLYYFELDVPELNASRYLSGPFMGVVSRINLTMKRNSNEMYVWATDLETLQPVSGASLTIYDDQNVPVATTTTDQNGLAWVSLPESANWSTIYYVLMGNPGDSDFALGLTSWTAGLSGREFGLHTDLKPQTSQLFTYLYTDRLIYRPGQTVNVRAILRRAENGRYFPSPVDQVTLQLFGEYAPETGERPLLATLSLPVSSYGTASGSFNLPEDALPGVYTLQTSHEPIASLTFQVAEYRKPEMELLVRFDSSEKQKGQDIRATVQANDYFGAPVSNLPVHWTLYTARDHLYLPGNYQSGEVAEFWDDTPDWFASPGMFLAEGDAETDVGGNLSLSFSADVFEKLDQVEGRQKLTLEVTAQGQSEYPVSSRASLIIHPADFYIGVRPDSWNGQVGQEIGYVIQTVGWDRKPSPMHALRADFLKVNWKQRLPEEISAGTGRLMPEYSPVSSSDFKTDVRGQARLAFIPPQPGLYLLEVRGNEAVTQVMTWVGGSGDAVWPDLPDQHLILSRDAETYLPGQTARILIPNPFNSPALALVTTERGRVMHTPRLLTIEGSSLELELPVADEDAPNIFLSVILLGRTSEGFPDFRAGYIEIPVDPSAYILNVRLTPQPSRTMPGGEVSYKVSVSDSRGRPVRGEFSLAIVDKAIFALAEPNSSSIIEAFYAPQPLGLETSLSLAGYARRITLLSQAGGLGGGEPAAPLLALREKFADTAYWQAKIETDANGQAEVTLKLPDNLTTWVATLRGLTKDALVGETSVEVVTGKDLTIRPVTPAFLVSGDHIELAAVINNNTKNSLIVDASLQTAGLNLDEPGKALQRITLPAGEQQRVSWWGVVQDTDQVELIFSVRSGNLQDAARPEQGKIPVLRYSVPQTLGVSGVLSQSGEKLEVVSLPRSYTPTSGQLRIELSPSLAASLLSDLKVVKNYPYDFTEPRVSVLLANVQILRTLQEFGLDSPSLKSELETTIADELTSLTLHQNLDGGWGWKFGEQSDTHTSAYALYGLSLAAQSGFVVEQTVFQKVQNYLVNVLQTQSDSLSPDELAFEHYVLRQSGCADIPPQGLYELREQMNPWAKALLALTLQTVDAADTRAIDLLSELKSIASRSSSGVYWESALGGGSRASPNLTTAIVVLALTELEPQSPLVADAVRFLTAHRRLSGGWQSSYETAWVIRALTNALKNSGDLQANYSFSAFLNDMLILNGMTRGDAALTPISTSIPISNLKPDEPNTLLLLRDGGEGNLYYRAYLQLYRPVESVPPLQTDILLTRKYYLNDLQCQLESCPPVDRIRLRDHRSVLVRLTLTVTRAINYLVVEDYIPAGSEILNRQLKTAAQGETTFAQGETTFAQGRGWWYFTPPLVYADHVRWMAQSVPAGVYGLTYELMPLQAGEFRVLPARAYAYYFPEVESSSGGSLFSIEP